MSISTIQCVENAQTQHEKIASNVIKGSITTGITAALSLITSAIFGAMAFLGNPVTIAALGIGAIPLSTCLVVGGIALSVLLASVVIGVVVARAQETHLPEPPVVQQHTVPVEPDGVVVGMAQELPEPPVVQQHTVPLRPDTFEDATPPEPIQIPRSTNS